MSDIQATLSQAYDYIEAGELQEARNLLEPLTLSHPDNPDVWWLYSYAVDDREMAQKALERVVSIDPDYEDASELLEESQALSPVVLSEVEAEEKQQDSRSDLDDEDSLDFDDDDLSDDLLDEDDEDFLSDFDNLDDEDDIVAKDGTQGNQRRIVLSLLSLIGVIIIVIILFVILNSSDDDDDNELALAPSQTPISAQVAATTPEATSDDPAVTEVPAEVTNDDTNNGADSGFSDQYAAFASLEVIDDSIVIESTDFGQTLLVSVCTIAGDTLRETLTDAMTIWAEQAQELDVDATGVQLVDCETDQTLNIIAVSVEDAIAVSEGTITQDDFRSRWRPVR